MPYALQTQGLFYDAANGNVGVATTSPGSKLTVVTPTNVAAYGIEHSGDGKTLATYVDGTGGWLGTVTNDPLLFYTNNSLASQLSVTPDGHVGINVDAPGANLEVHDPTGSGTIVTVGSGGLDTTYIGPDGVGGPDNGALIAYDSTGTQRAGLTAKSGSGQPYVFVSDGTTFKAHLSIDGTDHGLLYVSDYIGIGVSNPTQPVQFSSGAYLDANGNLHPSSDRNAKTALRPIDPQQVLAQVLRLPILSWQYRNEKESVRHIGPMAQDFHSAFHMGDDDKTISTLDSQGVALAAIQGLHRQIQEKDARIQVQQQQIDALSQRLARLEAQLHR